MKLMMVVTMMFSAISAAAQVKAFEKYSDMKGVSYVYISKAMLKLASNFAAPSIPGTNMDNIIPKLSAIQIISAGGSTSKKIKADAINIVNKDNYEMLMQVDEDDNKVRIYHREGSKQSVIIMLSGSQNGVAVIVFSGSFTLKDIEAAVKDGKA